MYIYICKHFLVYYRIGLSIVNLTRYSQKKIQFIFEITDMINLHTDKLIKRHTATTIYRLRKHYHPDILPYRDTHISLYVVTSHCNGNATRGHADTFALRTYSR